MNLAIAFQISRDGQPLGVRRLPLAGVVTLGSAPSCDVVLDDPAVAAQHLFVFPAGEQVRLVARGGHDFRIGGMPVRETLEIDTGVFDLGPFRLTFQVEVAPVEAEVDETPSSSGSTGSDVWSSARPTGEVLAPRLPPAPPRPPVPSMVEMPSVPSMTSESSVPSMVSHGADDSDAIDAIDDADAIDVDDLTDALIADDTADRPALDTDPAAAQPAVDDDAIEDATLGDATFADLSADQTRPTLREDQLSALPALTPGAPSLPDLEPLGGRTVAADAPARPVPIAATPAPVPVRPAGGGWSRPSRSPDAAPVAAAVPVPQQTPAGPVAVPVPPARPSTPGASSVWSTTSRQAPAPITRAITAETAAPSATPRFSAVSAFGHLLVGRDIDGRLDRLPLALLASAILQLALVITAEALYVPDDTVTRLPPPPSQWAAISARFEAPSTPEPTPTPLTEETGDAAADAPPAPRPAPRPTPRATPEPAAPEAPVAEAPTPAEATRRKVAERVRSSTVLGKKSVLDSGLGRPKTPGGSDAIGTKSPLGKSLGSGPLGGGKALGGGGERPGVGLGGLGKYAGGKAQVKGTARLGPPASQRYKGGSVTERKAIRRAIHRRGNRFQLCLDHTARQYPDLAGRLEMSFDIDADGRPQNIRGRLTPSDNKTLVDCFVREIGKIRFNRDTPGVIGVTYPFVVRSS